MKIIENIIMKNVGKLPYERPFLKKLETGIPNKFGEQSQNALTTHIEGIAVKKLLNEYGSPLFVLSEKEISKTLQNAKLAFTSRYPKIQFAWPYKTNYLDAVCRLFHQQGSWAEVVSGFEYQKAIHNGVPGNKIIFNGPGKTELDLITAVENESLIHIDNFEELDNIICIAKASNKNPKVALRINMDAGIYPQWDRFGFNLENGQSREAIHKIMLSKNLELEGLHCHIGTFILSTEVYAVAARKLAELSLEIKNNYNYLIKYIDIGGGFASKNTLKGSMQNGCDLCPDFDDYAEAISSAILDSGLNTQELPLLILETGRALIDEAGCLLGTVVANKRLANGKCATIIDIGVNLLFTSFWYEHKITPAQESSSFTEDTVVYGPLCMNIDTIRENVNLPQLSKGNHVVIHHTGAYNMTQWLQFITLRPKVVMIDTQGKVHIIRENETTQSISYLERIPAHLDTVK